MSDSNYNCKLLQLQSQPDKAQLAVNAVTIGTTLHSHDDNQSDTF